MTSTMNPISAISVHRGTPLKFEPEAADALAEAQRAVAATGKRGSRAEVSVGTAGAGNSSVTETGVKPRRRGDSMNLRGMATAALTLGVLATGIGWTRAATILINADIVASTTWTADNEYILTKPIYVTSGATLTIEAGTVVRGQPESAPGANDPGTLIIARDSKIQALGTRSKPIIFTDLDDDNIGGNPGTAPYDNLANAQGLTGRWGGLILLGRTYVANNTGGAANPAREVQIEGLTATGGKGLYGNCSADATPPLCDDDDSGSLSYVSIRYNGFNLSANNEINGLTLGAVGRSTDIEYIEVMNPKDDGVECFGGTVGLKHIAIANSGDDSLDLDEGFRGKVQFYFVIQGTPGTDKSDKGMEMDGGNVPDNSQPRTIPTLYNVTEIGLGQKAYTDKLKNTALHFRDNAGGRHYNSFFGDFGGATMCIEGGNSGTSATAPDTSGARAIALYTPDGVFYRDPDSDFELELQNDTFWCFGAGQNPVTGDNTGAVNGCDASKIHYDNGAFTNASLKNAYLGCATPLPIRTLVRTPIGDATKPDPITSIDPRPGARKPAAHDRPDRARRRLLQPGCVQGRLQPGEQLGQRLVHHVAPRVLPVVQRRQSAGGAGGSVEPPIRFEDDPGVGPARGQRGDVRPSPLERGVHLQQRHLHRVEGRRGAGDRQRDAGHRLRLLLPGPGRERLRQGDARDQLRRGREDGCELPLGRTWTGRAPHGRPFFGGGVAGRGRTTGRRARSCGPGTPRRVRWEKSM